MALGTNVYNALHLNNTQCSKDTTPVNINLLEVLVGWKLPSLSVILHGEVLGHFADVVEFLFSMYVHCVTRVIEP